MLRIDNFSPEGWESYDVRSLFPDRLHANLVTRIDGVDLQMVDAEDAGDAGKSDGDDDPPQDGDSVCEASSEPNHVDHLYEMEGEGVGAADDREVKADKEEDKRTESPESPSGESSDAEAEDEGDSESDDTAETAEKPIQKESEGVEEVAEATSKTSEEVHGGDEATKDIEGSPNAANDGLDTENHGAEDGVGGDDGDGEGDGESSDGSESSEPEEEDPFEEEDWELQGANSAGYQLLTEIASVRPKRAAGGGDAVDYSGVPWDGSDQRKVFYAVRELIKKLTNEEDFSQRTPGAGRWDAKALAKAAVKYQHPRIPDAKFQRPKTNKLVFFVDVSGSVSTLAELFMALMGGAAGLPGVHIVVGSEAHAQNEIIVPKPFKRVEEAISFFRSSLGYASPKGWQRPYEQPFEPGIKQFLQDKGLWGHGTTCLFFGDMQAVNFSVPALHEIVRKVNCLWLFTDGPGHFTHTGDLPRAIKAKLPIVYNVRAAKPFVKAVRKIQR